jgi:hypothetical protein
MSRRTLQGLSPNVYHSSSPQRDPSLWLAYESVEDQVRSIQQEAEIERKDADPRNWSPGSKKYKIDRAEPIKRTAILEEPTVLSWQGMEQGSASHHGSSKVAKKPPFSPFIELETADEIDSDGTDECYDG